MTSTPFLSLRSISKDFGHIAALQDVALDVELGEVLAIVGDNGAGKSTLMSVMLGLLKPSSGTIAVNGEPIEFHDPADAARAGIGAVTQDLALVECLDVATNMFIGQTPTRFGIVDRRRMRREATTFLKSVNATVPDVTVQVGMLSGGQRQMVAIARALRSGAPMILMDEPTAALGVRETALVAELIEALRDQGKAVVIVSHDLELVLRIADRVQVMRLGRSRGAWPVSDLSRDDLVGLITGTRDVPAAGLAA
ncbi:ATP-binding cassette domain-containing protein [Herbiconiux sp. UC225_62]|uniref:ATP-binding cassette domain-containing protein n=1 Tax=Herbiconiux sp. UC225_62 TaxID=3350168 RepID=UPI0036D42647